MSNDEIKTGNFIIRHFFQTVLLLLDTSTTHLAIGLADEAGAMLREFNADAAEGERGIHDARLALETANLLNQLGSSAREISRIGLIIGPGSFTGLRIGLSFAKGLCVATGAALVPLTQHEIMFEEAPETDHRYIITPGYREDLFYVSKPNELRNIQLLSGETVSALGNVPMLLHDYFLNHPTPFFSHDASFVSPSLSMMARLTACCPVPLRDGEIDGLEPLYLTEFKTAL
ncbi:MAG TPA: tRNA (adenosine(37)-N6)-threonylcarbamoyltransferase complex dimerization subunit type 1 TsaB [Candidatus Kapabacteria bacterium]|nr:tRNA (adenosine(37)-N6)-threonylcarbamoyltransferase complex dimerization subunit type 1 TsaB [Candidatus Kapabacteria bacterium]